MADISVVIPVGPDPAYLEWLPECIESVWNQTHPPKEIIIIDDGKHFAYDDPVWRAWISSALIDKFPSQKVLVRNSGMPDLETGAVTYGFYNSNISVILYRTLWNVGVADAFNFGVSLSTSDLVFMLGSDDKLHPDCLELCVESYEQHNLDAWYHVTIETQGGEIVQHFNNAAMVTKKLWNWLGGFPPSSGVAACDAVLISILMVHAPTRLIQVAPGKPLYWAREHDHQDTRKNTWYYAKSGVIEQIRNMETIRFSPVGTL